MDGLAFSHLYGVKVTGSEATDDVPNLMLVLTLGGGNVFRTEEKERLPRSRPDQLSAAAELAHGLARIGRSRRGPSWRGNHRMYPESPGS